MIAKSWEEARALAAGCRIVERVIKKGRVRHLNVVRPNGLPATLVLPTNATDAPPRDVMSLGQPAPKKARPQTPEAAFATDAPPAGFEGLAP